MMKTAFLHIRNLRDEQDAETLLFVVITMLLVVATLFGINTDGRLVLCLMIVGVVLLGLPHGSLDPHVARKIFAGDRRFTLTRFLLVYTLLAFLCAAGWLAAPNVGLCIFLIISALHFGSDWLQRGGFWGRAAYGTCIVSLPTLCHAEVVRKIYVELGATAAADIVKVSRVVACFAVAVAFLSLLRHRKPRWRDCLELVVIVIGSLALQPLAFFLCYFCLLHSPRHLAGTAREVGLRGARAILTAVTPPVVATLLLSALLWHFLPAQTLSGRLLGIVFIGLGALTVPHVLLTGISERARRLQSSPQRRHSEAA